MDNYGENLMIIAIAVGFMKNALPWIISGLFAAVLFTILPDIKSGYGSNKRKDNCKAAENESDRQSFEHVEETEYTFVASSSKRAIEKYARKSENDRKAV